MVELGVLMGTRRLRGSRHEAIAPARMTKFETVGRSMKDC